MVSDGRLRLELHCHSSASFDGHTDPPRLAQLAFERRLTHLAVTDHDTIEGALRAREAAPVGLTVIVGQEARTTEGDMIALFVKRPIPSGLTPADTSRRIREQGGLVGLPHPFDVSRPSIGLGAVRPEQLARLARLADYVEVHNGRVSDPQANARAADFARAYELPGAAVSDAHTDEVLGTAATMLDGPADTTEDLRRALGGNRSLFVREPVSQLRIGTLQQLLDRLNGRIIRSMDLTERCLVTGGAGFVGAGVVRALIDRGYDVTVLDNGAAAGFGYVEQFPVRLVKADLGDREAVPSALEGCRSVIHLAAQTSVPDSIGNPLDDLRSNVDASVMLLDAARHHGIRRFVFASSNAVVGGHPSPMRENLTAFPVSPYGAAKASVEAYMRAYWEAYGLDGVALRFANAYGPCSEHKPSVVSAFIKAYLRGGPLIIRGDGSQTRDFVHVDDVVSAVMLSLEAPAEDVAGEIFQVGTGHETSLLELANVLFSVGGAEAPLEFHHASPGDVARNVSDISKARDILGYAPRVELRDGMGGTLEWFRANRRLNGSAHVSDGTQPLDVN